MNATGEIKAKYTYDSWSNTISVTDSTGNQITDETSIGLVNPIRYRGYYLDSETGMYYLQSRYYDPGTCRFINADSQLNPKTGLSGMNLFAYCNNNSIIHSDPNGHIPFFVEC